MPDKHTNHEQQNAGTSRDEQAQYWDQDLRAGVMHPEKADGVKTAYDIKALHNRLSEFTDDELKQLPVLPHRVHALSRMLLILICAAVTPKSFPEATT